MNKSQLVDAVAAQVGDRALAATTVEAVLDAVTRAVAGGERVALTGFGVFERVERGARTARNPATGGTVEVAATSVPRFRAGQGLKDAVSGKRDLPPAPTPAGDAAASGASGRRSGVSASVSGRSARPDRPASSPGDERAGTSPRTTAVEDPAGQDAAEGQTVTRTRKAGAAPEGGRATKGSASQGGGAQGKASQGKASKGAASESKASKGKAAKGEGKGEIKGKGKDKTKSGKGGKGGKR